MENKKLLIRLFLTMLFLMALYSLTKSSICTLAKDVDVKDVEVKGVECVTHNDPPAGVANIIAVKKKTSYKPKKQVIKTSNKKYMGRFKLTGYCACAYCCGKTDGITSTGVKARAGRTIAVDPRVIPYGSIVIINGKEYVAEDCGGAIKNKKIDIFFNTHNEALQWGVKYADVYVKVGD